MFLNPELIGSSLKSPIDIILALGFIFSSESIICLFRAAAFSRIGRLLASPPKREGQ